MCFRCVSALRGQRRRVTIETRCKSRVLAGRDCCWSRKSSSCEGASCRGGRKRIGLNRLRGGGGEQHVETRAMRKSGERRGEGREERVVAALPSLLAATQHNAFSGSSRLFSLGILHEKGRSNLSYAKQHSERRKSKVV